MGQCCRGLIVRAWFADDDLEAEKSADIEIWSMVDEVHLVCRRRTSPRIMSRSWDTAISRVERRIP